jgi:hypothetical protein
VRELAMAMWCIGFAMRFPGPAIYILDANARYARRHRAGFLTPPTPSFGAN